MSTTTPKEQQSRQGGSAGFIIAAILIVLAVLVTGVVLASLNLSNPDNPDPDPIYPIDPDPDPQEFLQEGEYYFKSKYDTYRKDYEFAPTAIIRSWDDVEEYFNHLDNIISEAYANSGDFDFDEHDYLLVRVAYDYCGSGTEAVGITDIRYGDAKVLAEQEGSCGVCAPQYEYWLIEIDDYRLSSATLSYSTINSYHCDPNVAYKPVIYLYPTEETKISVKLGAKEKLLVSYPTYIDGWKVLATPDGKLTDLQTGRKLYSLYYEADNTVANGVREEGFVVKGSDTISFLEEKLAKLGLSDTEAEEFIVYWLPQMQNNAYNYIYFAVGDEVAKNMPLDVSPAPATSIRINMEWKALTAPISVKEQKLPKTPARKGFTLVEWGGTILK